MLSKFLILFLILFAVPLYGENSINSPQEFKFSHKISGINFLSNIKSPTDYNGTAELSPTKETSIQFGYRNVNNIKSSEATIKGNYLINKNSLNFSFISPFMNKDVNKKQTDITLNISPINNISFGGNYKNTGDKKTELGQFTAKGNYLVNKNSLSLSYMSPFINKDMSPEQTNVNLAVNSIEHVNLLGNYLNSDGKSTETYKASYSPSSLLSAEANVVSTEENTNEKYSVSSNLFDVLKLNTNWEKNLGNSSNNYNLSFAPNKAISIESNISNKEDVLLQKYKINSQIGEYLSVNSIWARKDIEDTSNDTNVEFKMNIVQLKSNLINYKINNIGVGIVFIKNGLMAVTHNQNDLENWQIYSISYNLNKLKSCCKFNTQNKELKSRLDFEYNF